METWFITIVTVCIAAVIRSILFRRKKLPPGPPFLSAIFLLLTNSIINLEPVLINLKARYGPIFTLSTGVQTHIVVGSRSIAHQVLVQKGAVFSDRHKSIPVRTIATSSYGPAWRLFRRNLASEVMHPARIRSYAWARKRVLQLLVHRLEERQEVDGVKVLDHFQYVMFCVSVFMCFGDIEETKVNEIFKVQRNMHKKLGSGWFNLFLIVPGLGKIVFRNRWKEFEKFVRDREQVMIPLIKSRMGSDNSEARLGNEGVVAYVDTLVNLQLPDEEADNGNGGKLTDREISGMCSEFLNAGMDSTSTVLQWIMANLVKHPHIQSKLYNEILSVVGPSPPRKGAEIESVINEEDLQKMSYLKAVVLEGLRRHPPGRFALPHRVMKEVEVQGYTIPQGATIHFMLGQMGLDPAVWDDPMEFKPERFLENDGVFDITGSKGITMMPFGVGRRICPGSDLAMLHLEYFVANLIWHFNWTVPDGCLVDLSEKMEFTVVMKNPLRAQLSSRAQERIT